MFSLRDFMHMSVSFLAVQGLLENGEPNCRFDHDYKVLQKLAELESRLNRLDHDNIERSKPAHPSSSLVGSCSDGWVTFKNECFLFENRNKLSWQRAKEFCTSVGGNLPTISSRDKNDFIHGFTGRLFNEPINLGFWMGAEDLNKDGIWTWEHDGSRVRDGFNHWYRNQGDESTRSDENCGCLWKEDVNGFQWHDCPCKTPLFVICEKK